MGCLRMTSSVAQLPALAISKAPSLVLNFGKYIFLFWQITENRDPKISADRYSSVELQEIVAKAFFMQSTISALCATVQEVC